jgi:hypothetical protein
MSAPQAPGDYGQQPAYPQQGYGQPQQNYPPPQAQGYPPQTYQSPGYGAPYASPPPAAAPPPRKSKGWLIPFVLIIVGVVLVGVSLGVGWYTIGLSGTEDGFSVSTSSSINLFQCVTTTASANGQSSTSSSCNTNSSSHTAQLYDATLGIVIGGVAVGALALVMVLLTTFMRRPWGKLMTMLPFILALVGGILCIAAPIALMAGQPGAMAADANCGNNCQGPESSFFGSATISGVSETWGAGIGWYLAIAAGAVLIVGAIFIMLANKKKAASAPMAAPAAYGQPQQGGYYGGAPPAAAPYSQPAPAPQYAQPAPAPQYAQPAPAPQYAQPAPAPAPYQPAQNPQQGYRCAACGYVNPPGYNTCLNCKQRMF